MHRDGLRYFERCLGKHGPGSSHLTFPQSAHEWLEMEWYGSYVKSNQNFRWFRFHQPEYSWNDWWEWQRYGLLETTTWNTFRYRETIDADCDDGEYANENIEYNVAERQKTRRAFSNGCRYHQWKWGKLGHWDGSHKNAGQAQLRLYDFSSDLEKKFQPIQSCNCRH